MKITETIMIYSVDQVAQERGYPLSRQCHQYLGRFLFFFFFANDDIKGAFHLSELTGQALPFAMIILL